MAPPGAEEFPSRKVNPDPTTGGPAKQRPSEVLDRMYRAGNFQVYAVLLNEDQSHPIAKLFQTDWDDLHENSPPGFLFVTRHPVERRSAQYISYWKEQLGRDWEETFEYWKSGQAAWPGRLDRYLEAFTPRPRREDLPCFAFFTSLKSRRAILVPIPRWSRKDLREYMRVVFDAVRHACTIEDPDKRKVYLERELASWPARLKRDTKHAAGSAAGYAKAHPMQVATVGVTLLTFLVGGPMASFVPAAAVTAVQGLDKVLKSGKDGG